MITDDEVMSLFEQADPARADRSDHGDDGAGDPRTRRTNSSSVASTDDGAAEDLIYLGRLRTRPEPRRWIVRTALGAAAAVLLVAGIAAIRQPDERTPVEPAPTPSTVGPRTNGRVAQQFGTSIWFVPGDAVEDYPGEGEGFEACPAFSPEGERLLFGLGGLPDSNAALEIVSVAMDGSVSLETTIPLGGIDIPCAIWAPDGRWVALGGDGEVLVVDTETAEVRRLAGYDATDLEWRPGTDELAITGRDRPGHFVGDNAPITLYKVSTGETRTLGDIDAVELTWSPDGSTLAVTQAVPGAADRKSGITLIDADGTDPRPLTTDDYVADHGIGVTWSPRGDQIAYQRERTDCTGDACYERSEVVLVTATNNDPANPIGTERTLPAVVDNLVMTPEQFNTTPPFNDHDWFARSVTWSPDGTELLYHAGRSTGGCCLIVVPVDGDAPARVLDGDALIGEMDDRTTSPRLPLQSWQGLP